MATNSPPSDVVARIATFTPRSVPADRWSHLAPFVRQIVTDSNPSTMSAAERTARVVGQLASFAIDCHVGLDREVILSPDFIGRFVLHLEHSGRPASTVGTYHSTLKAIAPQVTRTAPWPPTPEHSRTNTPPPYDWATIDSYVRNAAAQTTLLRTNRALVIIALAAGAGLRASEIRTFAGRDLDEGHVAVGGIRPRVVPVNDRMLHVLLDGIGNEAGPVFTDHKNALNSVTQSLMFDPVLPRMDLRRLRNTWISSRLEELSVIELMTQSGLTSVRVIDDLVRMRTWGTE